MKQGDNDVIIIRRYAANGKKLQPLLEELAIRYNEKKGNNI